MTTSGVTSTDRPCWGERGLSLLPVAWRHRLPRDPLALTRPTSRTRRRDSYTIQMLSTTADWSRYVWSEMPTEMATGVLDSLLTDDPDPDFMDLPILTGWFRDPGTVARLPFLTTTWAVLDEFFDDHDSIARMLCRGTALELLQLTGSSSATLDIAITAPSWVDTAANGSLTVTQPTIPSDLVSCFEVAGLRHLRAACVADRFTDPEQNWFTAIAGRAGIRPEGCLSLERAGDIAGVTRERIRQLTRDVPLGHQVRRRWPLPSVLRDLEGSMLETEGLSRSEAEVRINVTTGEVCYLTFERATEMLGWFGHEPELMVGDLGHVRPVGTNLDLPEGLTLEAIPPLVWKLSSGTGFLQESDLVRELRRRHPEIGPEDLAELLDIALADLRLPLGYLFHTTHADSVVVGVLHRMLAWTGDLSIDDFHHGLTRKFLFRGLPLPPPPIVLEHLIHRLDDFVITNGRLSAVIRQPINPNTILGWIGTQLSTAPSHVLHRSILLESARQAGLNTTSVGLYISYGEIVQPIGRNCFTLIGYEPSPSAIENARQDARLLRIPDRISVAYEPESIVLTLTVGSAMRNSGNLSMNRRSQSLIGPGRFRITSELGTHGTCALSGSLLYGFSTAFNALDVMTGDDLVIELDVGLGTATVRSPEEPDPTGEPAP